MSQINTGIPLYKPNYELQANDTTILMTKSMKEINDAWSKSSNCKLYQFNADGSKFFVNEKKTPMQKIQSTIVSAEVKSPTPQKQKKPKLGGVAEVIERKVSRIGDRTE